MLDDLASYRHCLERLRAHWPDFVSARNGLLREQERNGTAPERVTEAILEKLFTGPLDWELADLNHQVDFADLVLSHLHVKYLVVEAKRPGALAWNRRAVDVALDQAAKYAHEQNVNVVAVSDGIMIYAADLAHGGRNDRVFATLDATEPDESLWWLSLHGIYRPRTDAGDAGLRLLPERAAPGEPAGPDAADDGLLHPKYKIPCHCFAYVGHAGNPHTWKLPYRLADGSIDMRRLPKAIQAILSNYRGTKVHGIPEPAIPDVLVRLGRAAAQVRKLPHQGGESAPAYVELADALRQLNRMGEVQGV